MCCEEERSAVEQHGIKKAVVQAHRQVSDRETPQVGVNERFQKRWMSRKGRVRLAKENGGEERQQEEACNIREHSQPFCCFLPQTFAPPAPTHSYRAA